MNTVLSKCFLVNTLHYLHWKLSNEIIVFVVFLYLIDPQISKVY